MAEDRARQALFETVSRLYPAEAALGLSGLEPDASADLLASLDPALAPGVFAALNPDHAVGIIRLLDDDAFQRLSEALDPAILAALLGRLRREEREARLHLLPAGLRRELERLVSYPPDTAGGIMDPLVTVFRAEETVAIALERIRSVRRAITDLCIVDADGRLHAVVPLQEVAVSSPDRTLGSLANGVPASVPATAPRSDVVEMIESHKLLSLPVTSFEGRLLGIIRYDALVEAARNDATESLQAMAGAGREERAMSSAWTAIRKRLPWLQINLGTAFLAAAVVGIFEDTIARFTMLAIFLPVVAGQSGNTGAQSLAVTMRGLALREIGIRHWPQVAGKEVLAGLVNGLAVALTTAGAAYLWTGTPGLPIVIAISMVFSMVMAGLAGASIPVLLTMLRQDPAQSSSIILTTVTDVVGFLSFLGLATFLASAYGLSM